MELKSKAKVMLCLLTLIAAMLLASMNTPITLSSPETYGPRLDDLYGKFVESPDAQNDELYAGTMDIWPDIRDPVMLRQLETDDFTVVSTVEAMLYYHMDFNLRDQIGNGTHTPCTLGTWSKLWRGPLPRDPEGDATNKANYAAYYTYLGTPGQGFIPLNDTYFRHAIAHCIPKDEIVAVVYGGISAGPVDSLIPEAQRAWYKPEVDGHPLNPGDPTATTIWNLTGNDEYHDACSILRAGGYVWDPEAENPAPKWDVTDPDGNWIDPVTGEPMNHVQFSGVTYAIAPGSHDRDAMCARDSRHIGLPLEHVEVDYSILTETMMDYYEYDMYALGWQVTRFPDHLYSFFHSSNNLCPEGYNIPGVNNPELDYYTDLIMHSTDVDEVKQAVWDATDLLAKLCVSIPTVTRPLFLSARHTDDLSGLPEWESVMGLVNVPGFGSDTDYTYASLHWNSSITEADPYGIGGSMNTIVPSKATNYHPAFASTTDEWLIMQNVVEGLINIDPYTHQDIPWLATDWTIEDWYCDGNLGMNTTFWLRDDVHYHDGAEFNASVVKYSLEWLQDMEIGRAQAMWQDLIDVQVHSPTKVSVYHNASSLFLFYDIAGWAAYIPKHIYDGTDIYFHPEEHENPLNPKLTCLVGTGPFVLRSVDMGTVGGQVHLSAFRDDDGTGPGETPSPVGDYHWWQSVEGYEGALTVMFHWIGDGDSSGIIDIDDLNKAGKVYGQALYPEIFGEDVGTGDGSTTTFTLDESPVLTDLEATAKGKTNLTVYLDDIETTAYSIVHATGVITFDAAPTADTEITADYTWGPNAKYDADADTNPEPTYHTNDERNDMRDIAELSKNWGKQRHYPRRIGRD